MKRMAWIAVAALATLVAVPALADSRQTSEDQPGQSGGAQSGTQSGTGEKAGGQAPSDGSGAGSSTDNSGGTQSAAQQPTMKELLAGGYEVKSVVLVPRDVVKRGGATDSVDAVVIMLQNGAALATCYEEYSSFVSDPTTLACTVYK